MFVSKIIEYQLKLLGGGGDASACSQLQEQWECLCGGGVAMAGSECSHGWE